MTQEKAIKCEVCDGLGLYPIMNRHGRELYSIRCPECHGCGPTVAEPDIVETDPWMREYPPSTAAHITSMDQLRLWTERSAS